MILYFLYHSLSVYFFFELIFYPFFDLTLRFFKPVLKIRLLFLFSIPFILLFFEDFLNIFLCSTSFVHLILVLTSKYVFWVWSHSSFSLFFLRHMLLFPSYAFSIILFQIWISFLYLLIHRIFFFLFSLIQLQSCYRFYSAFYPFNPVFSFFSLFFLSLFMQPSLDFILLPIPHLFPRLFLNLYVFQFFFHFFFAILLYFLCHFHPVNSVLSMNFLLISSLPLLTTSCRFFNFFFFPGIFFLNNFYLLSSVFSHLIIFFSTIFPVNILYVHHCGLSFNF